MSRSHTGSLRLTTQLVSIAVLQCLHSETSRLPTHLKRAQTSYTLPKHAWHPDAHLAYLWCFYPATAAPQLVLPSPGGRTGHGKSSESPVG